MSENAYYEGSQQNQTTGRIKSQRQHTASI